MLNGVVEDTNATVTEPTLVLPDVTLGALARSGTKLELDGRMDEVRIRTIDVTDDFKTTEYNNQSDPSSFAVAGSIESNSGGWNNVVKPQLLTSDVTRVSDTEIDITLQAYATFDITADEDITTTIPTDALDSGGPIVATPVFTISALMGGFLNRNFFWGNY